MNEAAQHPRRRTAAYLHRLAGEVDRLRAPTSNGAHDSLLAEVAAALREAAVSAEPPPRRHDGPTGGRRTETFHDGSIDEPCRSCGLPASAHNGILDDPGHPSANAFGQRNWARGERPAPLDTEAKP